MRKHAPEKHLRIFVMGSTRFECLKHHFLKRKDEAELSFDFRHESISSWARDPDLDFALAAFSPTDVFVAVDPSDISARQAVQRKIRSYGAKDLWMVPPGMPWVSNKNFCPAHDLTVSGVASWAARAFSMVS